MYIYPDNLTGKATLFLWSLQDVVVIGARNLIRLFLSGLSTTELHGANRTNIHLCLFVHSF